MMEVWYRPVFVAVNSAIAVPGLLLLLIIATALSLLIGAKSLPASVVLGQAFSGTCQSADCTIVLDARLPRTLAGLLAGGALGLAGALMQTLTRNPLADPGLLGVNAGASFAIVLGAALFGYSSAQEQLAMAFAGALVALLIVAFTGATCGQSVGVLPWRAWRWRQCWRADQRHRPGVASVATSCVSGKPLAGYSQSTYLKRRESRR